MGAVRPDPGLEALKERIDDDDVETRRRARDAAAGARQRDMRWYVVHAYSGMEKAVERNLRERIDRAGMQDKFGRILVPTEEVVELKNGKKCSHRAPLLPRLRAGRDDAWTTTPGTW